MQLHVITLHASYYSFVSISSFENISEEKQGIAKKLANIKYVTL